MSELSDALADLDAAVARVRRAAESVPGPDPQPEPSVDPFAGVTAVRIGGAVYRVAAVAPPSDRVTGDGRRYLGGRGPDELVVYPPPLQVEPANRYGAAASVVGGVVRELVDRATGTDPGAPLVPADGVLVSGHGAARDYLLRHARPGARVEFLTGEVEEPPAGGGSTPTGRTLAVYLMDGVGRISQVPDNVTQVRVAFLQRGGLVEWGGDSPAKTAVDLAAWRGAHGGRRIVVSVGGAHGQVDVARVPGQIRAIAKSSFPVDGVDWDVEGSSLPVDAVVAASRDLATPRLDWTPTAGWVTSFVPPGGPPVATYLEAAKRCQAAGLRVQFGQQLYDAEVPQPLALSALAKAVDVLGPESVLVGMMIGPDAKHWTVDECESVARAALSRWPQLGGAYLWESARPGTAEWARRVGAVLGL